MLFAAMQTAVIDGVTYSLYTYSSGSNSAHVKKWAYDAKEAIIPDKIYYSGSYYNVTDINSEAFSGCKDLERVVIPEYISSIPNKAFYGCEKLKSITLNEGISSIGEYAFCGCNSLSSIKLPASVKYIFKGAFISCKGLVNVQTSGKIKTIGESAFQGCTSLTEFNHTVDGIKSYAFSGCTSLRTAIASGNIYINEDTGTPEILNQECLFQGCTSLENVSIISNNRYDIKLSKSMFEGCSNLKEVNLPTYNKVEIGSRTFYGCKSLKEAPLTNVTSIGQEAFVECNNIHTISLPLSVASIWSDAFDFSSITKIVINPVLGKDLEFLQSASKELTLYAHRLDKTYIEKYWKGNAIYFEDTDISESSALLCRIDFSLNSTSDNLSFPINAICYASKQDRYQTKDLAINTDNVYSICDIKPEEIYYIHVTDGNGTQHTYAFKTATPSVTFSPSLNRTQTTLGGTVWASSDESANPECFLYVYSPDNILSSNCINGKADTVKGLMPGTDYTIYGAVYYNGKGFSSVDKYMTSTLGMNPAITVTATPTKLIFEGSYDDGDATVTSFGFANTEKEVKNGTFDGKMIKTIANLDPETKGETYFGVKVEENSDPYYKYLSGSTTKLTWSEGDYVATSTKSARLRVATNCDAETGTGIEWRRNDAPDNVKSTYVACPVVDGILVGSLRNLNPEVYYKFRPVYESASGNKYYGAWAGFYTGDASVYFAPEVRTLDDIEVFENSALVYCYVMPGSDDIRRQGIQYWHKGGVTSRADNGRMEITTNGIKSNASLPDLIPGTEYTYRAFAETASGTVYGEEKTFTTKGTSGIIDTFADKAEELTVSLRNNPSSSPVYVTVSGTNAVTAQVTIVSMTGRTVAQETIPTNTETEIELNAVPGYYLLITNDGVNQTSAKLIIRN